MQLNIWQRQLLRIEETAPAPVSWEKKLRESIKNMSAGQDEETEPQKCDNASAGNAQ